MHTLEVFYDYTCPFCLKGYELLKELIPNYPQVEAIWKPCELSPRRGGSSSSLPIRGFYFALDKGTDLWAYNDLMYDIVHNTGIDITDIGELANAVSGLLNKEDFRSMLENGTYMEELEAGNDYAYEKNGVWAVPAFRMDGMKLDSRLGIGVSKRQLETFLDSTL